jgi:hypothetical protein
MGGLIVWLVRFDLLQLERCTPQADLTLPDA